MPSRAAPGSTCAAPLRPGGALARSSRTPDAPAVEVVAVEVYSACRVCHGMWGMSWGTHAGLKNEMGFAWG